DVSDWPDDAIRRLVGLTRMRAGGLMKLRSILGEVGITCEPIEVWLEKDRRAWIKQRYIEKRWIATRNTIYRQLATEIADQCGMAIWEGDLGVKGMAERAGKKKQKRKDAQAHGGQWEEPTGDERAFEASQKWRVMASLSQFRVWIREAMNKRGRIIVDDETAYSSQICHVCNGKIEPSGKLIVECEMGHREDQDVNTARYYWNRADEDLRVGAVPLEPVRRSQVARLIRPISG